jgi:hypothetical protein
MRFDELSPEDQAAHTSAQALLADQLVVKKAAAEAAKAAREAERALRYEEVASVPANVASILALRGEVQRLADKINLILLELRG